jgi:hypothetical protein
MLDLLFEPIDKGNMFSKMSVNLHWTTQHYISEGIKKFRGLSLQANYTDQATAACWRS